MFAADQSAVLDSLPPNMSFRALLGEKTAVGRSWLLTQGLLNLHVALVEIGLWTNFLV